MSNILWSQFLKGEDFLLFSILYHELNSWYAELNYQLGKVGPHIYIYIYM